MKRTHILRADDGTVFETAAECKAHDEYEFLSEFISRRLPSQIKDALDRTDLELADAFERAAAIIARKRRESGDLKRKTAKSHADDTAAAMEKVKAGMKAIS